MLTKGSARANHSANGDARVTAVQNVIGSALEESDNEEFAWVEAQLSRQSWSLSADALRFLLSLVKLLKPGHILEFGSGLSTYVLARGCAELQLSCSITSVDHDPEFGAMTALKLEEQKLSRGVKIHIAPLVARECAGKMLPQYHLQPAHFASQHPPDLVIIDGPPAALGGREGIMYQVMDFARIGTLVLLDDAKRLQEKAALREWRANLGRAIEVTCLPRFTKGMAAIIVREPIQITELFEHKIRLIREQIAALIPSGATFILVNENNWDIGEIVSGRRIMPFLERDGQYWGPPADDSSAIQELERLRQFGASYIVFAWPSFWWFDYYCELHNHLRSYYRSVFQDERLVVFKLSG